MELSGLQCERKSIDERAEVLLCEKHTIHGAELFRLLGSLRTAGPAYDFTRRHEQSRDLGCVVYYLRFQDRIKIGTSRTIVNRLDSIPHDALLGLESGSYELERQRHRQFKHCHVSGEWFHADDQHLLAHIRSLPPIQMTPA
jgi:hypothetical protein